MTRKLTGKQVQEIREAVLDAYGSVDALRIMVRIELEETLEEIVGGDGLRVLVFNLITWAERTGRVDDLIQGAYRHNPRNQALQQFAQSWRSSMPSGPATAVPGTLAGSLAPSGPVSIDLFLSYSRKDLAAMHEVQETLREAGLSVWTDAELEPGTQSWQDAIEEAVTQAQAMVVLLSPNAKQSPWVKKEIGFAQAKNRRIFPVLIAGDAASVVPISLIDAQWVDGRENLRQTVSQDLLPAFRHHSDLANAKLEITRLNKDLALAQADLVTAQADLVTAQADLVTAKQKRENIQKEKRRRTIALVLAGLIIGAIGIIELRYHWPAPSLPPLLCKLEVQNDVTWNDGDYALIEVQLFEANGNEVSSNRATFEWQFYPPDAVNSIKVGNRNQRLLYQKPTDPSQSHTIAVLSQVDSRNCQSALKNP